MRFRKKLLIVSIIGIFLIVFATFLVPKTNKPVAQNNTQVQTTKPTIKINIDNQTLEFKDLSTNDQTTALDLTQKIASVSASGTGQNAFITGINGRQASNSKKEFWELLINGKPSEVGAGSYIVKSNDRLEWRISNY